MRSITTTLDAYLMPEDAAACRVRLLQLVSIPAEKWIIMYEASMPDFWANLSASHSLSHPVHLYADMSLARRLGESGSLHMLRERGVDVAIGSSDLGKYFVCHSKVIAVSSPDDQSEAQCWEGSLNFSETAWAEPNTVMIFGSNIYRDIVRHQWECLASWARANEPTAQIH